ncbi:hypothetical protein KY285_007664 [Solanum tuberosum]|nr:hypothetical protein KY285_007664 [Solanum tuberosum]
MSKEEMDDSGFIRTNLNVYGEEEPWEIYSQGVMTTIAIVTSLQRKTTMALGNNKAKKHLFKKNMHHVHKSGHWIMEEYEISPLLTCWLDDDRTDYVLCSINSRLFFS